MAIGDQNDVFERLKDNLVPWFGTDSPKLDGLLQGLAKTGSTLYSMITDAQTQTRIKTATGDALDLISLDYLGDKLPRRFGENDPSFRARILANIVQERATLRGMITVLTNLTGRVPTVIEGFNALHAGAYDQTYFYDTYTSGTGWLQPYTAIIYAYRPIQTGFQAIAAYDQSVYGFGYDFYMNNTYVDLSQELVLVTDADIIAAIEATKPYGTYMYVSIFD